jgi:hypothetical protein
LVIELHHGGYQLLHTACHRCISSLGSRATTTTCSCQALRIRSAVDRSHTNCLQLRALALLWLLWLLLIQLCLELQLHLQLPSPLRLQLQSRHGITVCRITPRSTCFFQRSWFYLQLLLTEPKHPPARGPRGGRGDLIHFHSCRCHW